MVDQIRFEKQHESRNIRELWATAPMLRRTLVACGIQIMGKLTPQLLSAYLLTLTFLSVTTGQNTGINVIKCVHPSSYPRILLIITSVQL